MSSFGSGSSVFTSGSNQFRVQPRSPLPTGLKRLHSDSSVSASTSKLARHESGGETAAVSTPIAENRERLLQSVYADVQKLHSAHRRHLAELFFLQNNGTYSDFDTWLSSPSPQLTAYLQAHCFDVNEAFAVRSTTSSQAISEQSSGVVAEERGPLPSSPSKLPPVTIAEDNKDTVKAEAAEDAKQQPATTSSSSLPSGASVTASTSGLLLPPSTDVSTISPAVLPVITLSVPVTVPSSSAAANIFTTKGPFLSISRLPEGRLPSKVAGAYSRLAGGLAPTHRGPGRPPGKKNANSALNGTRHRSTIPSGKIEHAAKQEAVILRRIAELRREGMWSKDKLPKCADPLRSKTHWDYLLEEMKWLATDFEQERKWKKAQARKLATNAVRGKKEEEEKQRRAELESEKELKRIASFAAKEVRQFWNSMEKVVEYKSDSVLEAKRKRALDKHLDFIVGQTERFSSFVQEGLIRPSTSKISVSEAGPSHREKGDSDYELNDSSEEDNESTLDKEEEQADKSDVDEEVAQLQRECEMDLDDVLQSLPVGYLEAHGGSAAGPSTSAQTAPDEEHEGDSSEESDHEAGPEPADSEAPLPEDVDFSKLRSENSDVRQQELTHFAENAEKLQPKGFTLETTMVVTKVPFLLKHQLREYQHVGLDWLVTLYDRKLNGILADEMGLGKTIQTIAVMAHLACEKGNWGPHLIIVPTTVMLNWEMEFKKWCPGFKILTYYGSVKERKEKRQGWSKPNAFHVCITSYKLVLQDHLVFRRKKWEYLVLDEAQNIKNFKSQRWQMLLNFNAQRRLLLTGTPLQNSLMELWSLMHFLMPEIFSSHRDFKDWFSNPVTDMIEGSRDFDEQTIRRLHKVLRPFILRRLKAEVEKQLPKKYEHVVSCPLSKRQRYLYDDFMSRASTREQLNAGNVMSVLNILMQLRKVCNHPNLFESRPITSPFITERLSLKLPSMVDKLVDEISEDRKVPQFLLLQRCRRGAFDRSQQLAPSRRLIEELSDDSQQKAAPIPPSAPVQSRVGEPKKKNFQFVIPPSVAQELDFNQPFLVQIQAPSGPKLVPIQLRPPPTEALAKIGIKVHPSYPPSAPAPQNAPVQLPVWRLSLPSQLNAPTLEPSSGNDGRRLAVVNYGTMTTATTTGTTTKPGFSVTLLRQPSVQSGIGRDRAEGAIRTRTVLYRPAVPQRTAPSTTSAADSSTRLIRPHITVQEVRPKTPPVVRYVDPTWAGPATSKLVSSTAPSTPVTPATLTASPLTFSSSSNLVSAITVSSSVPGVSTSKELSGGNILVRDTETTPTSSTSTMEATSNKPIETSLTLSGAKRSLPSTSGLEPVAKRRSVEHRQQILQLLATENERRNLVRPPYGLELTEMVFAQNDLAQVYESLRIPLDLDSLVSRFCIYTPAVLSGLPKCRSSVSSDSFITDLESLWPQINSPFSAVIARQMLQFPEFRLIEYDCGKLQILSRLLRNLKDDGHRCLIFTQMSKMLDILEAFLSCLGLKYLRLDGATRIEHRQVMMERFNQDPRIFCMILSTRSGGLGVNLTGADTVIFYDSDWNPTMDAQAQDRCHRIGQTRDVHIYRLISERTVEENILKKAEQKRRLGEVAIEEGGFTTEFFKKGNLKEIFELDVSVRMETSEMTQQELEQQMATLEDESDAQAARSARAETIAELSEFDESQAATAGDDVDPDMLEVEQKMKHIMSGLKPVERYAVKYLETLHEPERLDELQQTEEQIEKKKLKWELANRERIEQEEQQRKREEQEEFDLTYSYEDSLAQMFCPTDPAETMPIWMPPTPPMSDSEFDPYVESELGYLYNVEPMEEADLPPVTAELDLFRSPSKSESGVRIKTPTPLISRPPSETSSDIPAAVAETVANIRNSVNRTPKDGQPKSLFETGATAYRMKRDLKRPLTPPSPGIADQESTDYPEWTVLEDYALLTAVTKGQQMPYSLASSHAGHVPNWDYVSKWVSSVVGHHFSARACSNRYQYVILPREEGRVVTIDPLTKKARKLSMGPGDLGVKKFRMRTGQLFQQDGASVMAGKVRQRCTAVRQAMSRRQSNGREGLGLANCLPGTIHLRHELHLQSFGVNSERQLNPGQLVEMREERLKELKKQQLLQQQQQQQQQQMVLAVHAQQQQHPPVQVSFQPVPQSQLPIQHSSLAQYGQVAAQNQGAMEMQHQLTVRGTTPNYGVVTSSVTSGPLAQQLAVQQQQLDGTQIAVSVHPSNRLIANVQHVRQGTTVSVSSTQSLSTAVPGIGQMMASPSPRPHVMTGMASRPVSTPSGVTTATVYRQVGAAGGLIRAQRTPPNTPAPSGLHSVTSIGTIQQRSVPPQVSLAPIQLGGTSVEPSGASIIGPVVVQAPQTTVRFQAVSSAGSRQKIQFGGGGFLVSADVSKPTVLSVPQMQITGASASHQTVTPISIAGAAATRGGGLAATRHQMALAQSGLSASGKKNISLPRIASFTHGTNRGSGSPVHLVASPVTNRLAAAQNVHGVRQATSISAGMRVQGTGASAGRNIPSISMIMPINRMEAAPSAGATGAMTTSTPQSHFTVVETTTAPMLPSPQGTPSASQGYSTPTNRGQQ